MKRITLFLLFIGYYLCLPATNYFVATNGNDSNSGTIDKPFATLGKAQSKVCHIYTSPSPRDGLLSRMQYSA